MVRKIAVSAVTVAAIGGLMLGKDVFSYARTGVASARDRIKSEVPIEFEIERARREVQRLIPEVRKSMYLIAREQVEVARLQEGIAKRETSLQKQEEAILALSGDLKSQDSRFVYAGHKYSQKDVEKDLAERFNRFKIAEDTLSRERQLLTAKTTALESNRSTLEGMLSQKRDLEVQLEQLEARLRTIAARKQIHGLEVDDSHLQRVKGLIQTIERRLDVEDAVLVAEGELHGLIPVEAEQASEPGDVARQIDEYFRSRDGHSAPELARH